MKRILWGPAGGCQTLAAAAAAATALALALSILGGGLAQAQSPVLPAGPAGPAPTRSPAAPAARPERTITNFTPALRCMDEMLFRQGTRDVTLMMEEMRDSTQKLPMGMRDMMTSAIAEMTRRSRAVRLTVFGADQQNLLQFLQQAQKTSVFAVVPEFNLRGGLSQFDEDVKRQSASLGLLQTLFGLRLSSETRVSVLALDTAVVRTETMSLVPGVSSKNTTIVTRREAGAGDGQGRILGLGAVFSFATARSEGNAQAARNMVELAAIELVGRLVRAPYWQCLGTPDDHPEVQREIEDWFLSMDDDERVQFLKERLRDRRYYGGAIDGDDDTGLQAALALYRQALALPPAAEPPGAVDLAFFQRFVTATAPAGPLAARRRTATPTATATATAVSTTTSTAASSPAPMFPAPGQAVVAGAPAAAVAAPAAAASATQPAGAPPLSLSRALGRDGRLQLHLQASAAGFVYCYAQDPASGAIRRIFPNRMQRDPRLASGQQLQLPGKAPFSLPPTHELACVHAPREVYADLPPALRWGDFEDIALRSFADIRLRFAEASGAAVALVQAARP